MSQHPPIAQVIESIPRAELSDQERGDLLWMREEEKLAHDVYVALGQKWQLRPLQNITRAEAIHMQAVKALLDRYDVQDPVADRGPGEFADEMIQHLYDGLIAKGNQSVEDAIRVGLEIEELDIADLIARIKRSDNDDLKVVYQNLAKGSRNDLRAFHRQSRRNSIEYRPQHLSQEVFNAILLSDMERGTLIRDPDFEYPPRRESTPVESGDGEN